jgi:hypothetical protein
MIHTIVISRKVRTGKLEDASALVFFWVDALTPRILLQYLYHPMRRETYSDSQRHICFSPLEQSPAAYQIPGERSGSLSTP